MKKNDSKKNIRMVFGLYFILFICLQGYLIKFIAFDSKTIRTDPRNVRLSTLDNEVKRGSIYSDDQKLLAESVLYDGEYYRKYQFGKSFSSLIGNIDFNQPGIDTKYSFKLQGMELNFYQRLTAYIFDNELFGNDVSISVNNDLQNYVYEKLKDYSGAIIVTEPSTGKILAISSSPTYNPITISEDWDSLINDTENSPLLDRSTNGLYPPGSVFKIVTALDIIKNFENYEEYTYECVGEDNLNGEKIKCFNSKAHGIVNLQSAFTVSCNTYFAHVGLKMNNDNLKTVAEELLFNKKYDYPLDHSRSSFVLDETSSAGQTIQTVIGQGKTLMTPAHISLITSAIANDGVLMKPFIINNFITLTGRKTQKIQPAILEKILSKEEATILKGYMRNVVTSGTGIAASIDNISIAGKTGTAENSKGEAHALFTCFAPFENPQVTVTIILEHSSGQGAVVPMARDIVSYYLTTIKQN